VSITEHKKLKKQMNKKVNFQKTTETTGNKLRSLLDNVKIGNLKRKNRDHKKST